MQKRVKLVFAAAALALALVGCGGSSSSSSSSSEAASSAPASSAAASSEAAASSAAEETNGAGAIDLDAAFDELIKVNPISNQFEIAAMNIEYDFGLAEDDVVTYKGVKSNDNGDAGLVLVLETPAGKADDVAKKLETYKEDQVAFYGNYAEFAQAQDNVKNSVIGSKDGDESGFVVMVIASNEREDSGSLLTAVDDAIVAAMG